MGYLSVEAAAATTVDSSIATDNEDGGACLDEILAQHLEAIPFGLERSEEAVPDGTGSLERAPCAVRAALSLDPLGLAREHAERPADLPRVEGVLEVADDLARRPGGVLFGGCGLHHHQSSGATWPPRVWRGAPADAPGLRSR